MGVPRLYAQPRLLVIRLLETTCIASQGAEEAVGFYSHKELFSTELRRWYVP